jgi:hypothetical protein
MVRTLGRPICARVEANVTLDEAQLVLTGLAGLRQEDRQASALALIAVFDGPQTA